MRPKYFGLEVKGTLEMCSFLPFSPASLVNLTFQVLPLDKSKN